MGGGGGDKVSKGKSHTETHFAKHIARFVMSKLVCEVRRAKNIALVTRF